MRWSLLPKLLPQSSRREELQGKRARHLQQVPVACNQHICVASNGLRQDRHVGLVAYRYGKGLCPPHHRAFLTQEGFEFLNDLSGYPHLLTQDPVDLRDHRFPHDQVVLGEDEIEDIGAQPSSRDGAHEYVGIESNPHDTSRNTSSSARYPRASAKGMIRRRRSWNRASASWRRTASRITSLRLRPVRLAIRATCRSSAGSRRIVMAEDFMSCIVMHSMSSNKSHMDSSRKSER